VTVTKRNIINEMPSTYGTLRTTTVAIWHQVSRSAALEVSHRPVQRSQVLQYLTILSVKTFSILNAPPYLLKLSGAPSGALAESEGTLLSSRGAWKHLEIFGSNVEVNWSV
jgi:hypothetical protein